MSKKLLYSRFLILILLTCTFTARVHAQFPAIHWEKNQCAPYSGVEHIIQTRDGGYIFIGETQDASLPNFHGGASGDAIVVKLDSNGNKVWSKCYGGSDIDLGRFILQTFDGNYLFIGSTHSTDGDVTFNHGSSDVWLIKLNDTGGIMWQKTYGGPFLDDAAGGQQTADSGFIIVSRASAVGGDVTFTYGGEDYWVMKVSPTGTLLWQKSYGGSGSDEPAAIHITFDGGYIISGTSASNDGNVTGNHGSYDYWMLKLDDTGSIQWQKSLGGSQPDQAQRSCQQTSDSGYIVIGTTYSNDGDITGFHGMPDTTTDIWVVKLDHSGAIQWEKCYGGTATDIGYDISELPSHNYMISGYTYSHDGDIVGQHGGPDAWIARINSTGTIIGSKTAGGSNYDAFYSSAPASDGGYIAGGTTYSNNGDVTDTFSTYYTEHAWVVKFGADSTLMITLNSEQITTTNDISVYPSPTNGLVHIALPAGYEDAKFRIINLLGQEVPFEEQTSSNSATIYLQNIPDGMYLLQVTSKEKSMVVRVVYCR